MAKQSLQRQTSFQDCLCWTKGGKVCSFKDDSDGLGVPTIWVILDCKPNIQASKNDTLAGNVQGNTKRVGDKEK
jgi:hypothetical protein